MMPKAASNQKTLDQGDQRVDESALSCMQMNIMEVEELLKKFCTKYGFVKTSSWKFPYLDVGEVKSDHISNIYMNQSSSNNFKYIDLVELLVDRLYFTLMVVYKQADDMLSSVTNTASSGEESLWDLNDPGDSNDVVPFLDRQQISFPCMIRHVLSQVMNLKACFGKKNLIGGVSQEKAGKYGCMSSQTNESHIEGCATCLFTQDRLKKMANSISTTVEELQLENSTVKEVRRQSKDVLIGSSQFAVVLKWVNAFERDLALITSLVRKLLKDNTELRDKSEQERRAQEQTTRANALQAKVEKLEALLTKERDVFKKIKAQRDSLTERCKKLRSAAESQEMEFAKKYNAKLDVALQKIEEMGKEFGDIQEKSSQQFMELNGRLRAEEEAKKSLNEEIRNLEAKILQKDDDIDALDKTVLSLTDRNSYLNDENDDLKEKISETKEHYSKEIGLKENKITELEREVSKVKADMELLIMFPDLYGPVQQQMSPGKQLDCMEEMEKQVEANVVRIQQLSELNVRLSSAVKKVRASK